LHDYDKSVLHPWETWSDKKAYEEQRLKLAKMFVENFKQYTGPGSEFDYSAYGPKV
jgi:phosphoenolpyruvate carboxykinase (ATP)